MNVTKVLILQVIKYVLIVSERRRPSLFPVRLTFLSCLRRVGALTRGDRRAASGADLTEFNFDTVYGRSALRQMYDAITQALVIPAVHLPCASSMTFEEFNGQMQVVG